MDIVISVKIYFFFLLYSREFVLIMFIIFISVWGFSRDIEVVNKICVFIVIFFFIDVFDGLFFYVIKFIYVKKRRFILKISVWKNEKVVVVVEIFSIVIRIKIVL